jgi:PAS domain S-box-containing protein
MSPPQKRKLFVAAACVGLAAAGALAGWWNFRARSAALHAQLQQDAARAAVALRWSELQILRGGSADAGSPVFAAVRAQLHQLRVLDPAVRAVYVVRLGAQGSTLLLMDAADNPPEPGLAVEPPPAMLTTLREAGLNATPAPQGPSLRAGGTIATGFAPIDPPGPATTGPPPTRVILAWEIDASDWRRKLWTAGVRAAGYVWVSLGVPLTAWVVRRRQHAQREVIRNMSEAMEQSHSAIMIVNLESRVEYANRGLCQQIGYARHELLGRNWRDFQVHQADVAHLTGLVATVRSGVPWEGEWVNKRKDGSVYPVRGIVTPVKNRDGTLACFVAVFDDVTDAKRREAELREARDAALAADRAKGQFLATMSHEVRTPLNGVVGFTSLLLDTPLSPEQREYVQTIRMSAEALIQLTGDILDFARIESGKLKLDPLACDPRECVEEALDLLAATAVEKRIELLHHVADDVPAAVVTDGGRLRQILVNLVGNAVKFTDRGEVQVDVRLLVPPTEGAPPGGLAGTRNGDDSPYPAAGDAPRDCMLQFAVRDSGIGIAPEDHAKLFRPFSQVDESTTRRFGGTGLGLAICRNLVELMGGTISVASAPGLGSVFTFTIRAGVAVPIPPVRDLGGLRLGLSVPPGPLRRELAHLLRSWRADVIEVDHPEALAPGTCDLALVDASHDTALDMAAHEARHALPPAKTLGLVPISLQNDLRIALRARFRLLVNKPVHHEALFTVLVGSHDSGAAPAVTRLFGFRVLVVDGNPGNRRLTGRLLTRLGCMPTLLDTGGAAVSQLAQRPEDFDLVMLDLQAEEMVHGGALREIRHGKAGRVAQTMWIVALVADAVERQQLQNLDVRVNDYLSNPPQAPEVEKAFQRFRAERGTRVI